MIDFTLCEADLTANYGGSDQKRGIIYQGERYMLKMADRIPDNKRNSLNSYSNCVYSENVCCEILKVLGFDVQETLLGYITNTQGEYKPVVACKNFVPNGYSMIDFKTIEDFILVDRRAGKIPKLTDIYEIMKGNNPYFSEASGATALQRYWDTFILGALFGNPDRYANNWAYFTMPNSKELIATPIYDCGSCLYPQISDEAIPSILSSEDEIIKRIDVFPDAALELPDGKKANYREYINSLQNSDCTEALLRIFPKLDMYKINEVIYNNQSLPDARKVFYSTVLERRFERILVPAYEKAQGNSSLLVGENVTKL